MNKTTKRPRLREQGFPVHLLLTLEYGDEAELHLERTLSVPFVPYPGLYIEKTAETDLDVQMDTVSWIENAGFRVLCHPLTRPTWSYSDAVEKSGRDGWSVR